MLNHERLCIRYLGARIAGAIYFDRVSLYIIVPSPITLPFRRASVSLTTAAIDAISVIHLPASHLRARTIHPPCRVPELPISRMCPSEPIRCACVCVSLLSF